MILLGLCDLAWFTANVFEIGVNEDTGLIFEKDLQLVGVKICSCFFENEICSNKKNDRLNGTTNQKRYGSLKI